MDRKSYDQWCALAVALDHIGERWTLLIVRELLFGPRRYTDLREALPGIATNLLADRLRAMETDGLIARRRLPPPAASNVYELTERGRALEPSILSLIRWGSGFMEAPPDGVAFRTSWLALLLRAGLQPNVPDAADADFELVVEDERIRLQLVDGTLVVTPGEALEPDARLVLDPPTVIAIVSGKTSVNGAIKAGRARAEGRADAIGTLDRVFAAR